MSEQLMKRNNRAFWPEDVRRSMYPCPLMAPSALEEKTSTSEAFSIKMALPPKLPFEVRVMRPSI
jgi:hypothetical protein